MSFIHDPAFPAQADLHGHPHQGISRGEYFAVHAPNEIPDWFIHSIAAQGNRPKMITNGKLAWEEEILNQDEINTWDKFNSIERYFQWRKYFAEMICGLWSR